MTLDEMIKRHEAIAEENEKKRVGFGLKKVIQTMKIALNVPKNPVKLWDI